MHETFLWIQSLIRWVLDTFNLQVCLAIVGHCCQLTIPFKDSDNGSITSFLGKGNRDAETAVWNKRLTDVKGLL